jgi:DNA-binding LacI/PurR family transcriptional regulator/DNA-binding GntR family transcriptional regulator
MADTSPSKPLAQADAFLAQRVSEARSQGLTHLSTLKVLAGEAGVSTATMHKAVAALRSKGILSTAGSRSIRIVSHPPAQKRAVDSLLALVDMLRGRSESQLPTVVALAARAGVSLCTMARAISHLKDAGVLTASRGRAIRLAGAAAPQLTKAPTSAAPAAPPGHKWLRLTRELRADILAGIYPPGCLLPPGKELLSRYGVCRATLGKALAELNRAKTIAAERTRFRVPLLAGPPGRSTIVLVLRGTPKGDLFRLSPRTATSLRSLEIECFGAGLRLVVATWNGWRFSLLDPQRPSAAQALEREPLLGYIVWTMGLDNLSPDVLLQRLYGQRLPVAVFDESSGLRLPWAEGVRVKQFVLGTSAAAGRSVGRYLLGLGHRRVAFISSVHESDYSVNRLAGLSEAYAEAGAAGGVQTFTLTHAIDLAKESQQRWAATRRVMQAAGEAGVVAMQGSRFPNELASEHLGWEFDTFWLQQRLSETLAPLLEAAVAASDLTAWVGVNDEAALAALDFLRRRRTKVPQELSVLGLDNSVAATYQRLTSYNFNAQAAMRAMLAFVLDPRREPWNPRRDAPIEIEGHVNERATTARAG